MSMIVKADGVAERTKLQAMRTRAAQKNEDIERIVRSVLENVREYGYEAVRKYSVGYDHCQPYEIPLQRLDEAYRACPPALIAALEHAAANIRDYNQKLLAQSAQWTSPDGGCVGRIVRGLTRVGIYVPGGTAAYPSSVLMNAIPAKVAGVEEIVMVTPPTEYLNDGVLAAAKIAGVDRVIAVGGAQAIAALTYGAGFIPQVDKVVGPGNAFVATAKRLVYGTVDIDMVAGPSEVLIIADESANPKYIAADLLSQAEHDKLACAMLLTDSPKLAAAVEEQLAAQLGQLERAEIAQASMADFGAIIVCQTLQQCVQLANEIAPEHLELMTEDPRQLLAGVKNAGAVFLGAHTPEALGDYLAGPPHVLPTSGTARFFSPLSVDAFLKTMSVIEFDRGMLEPISQKIITLAESEKLTAHANSIRVRFEQG